MCPDCSVLLFGLDLNGFACISGRTSMCVRLLVFTIPLEAERTVHKIDVTRLWLTKQGIYSSRAQLKVFWILIKEL